MYAPVGRRAGEAALCLLCTGWTKKDKIGMDLPENGVTKTFYLLTWVKKWFII